ncbi:MOSC N-terminal beta barrel domain-containing protein [Actinopolymorpha sp. NPDC004070]|uniref:MOSC domain-containing protein n=1 Tax=Actinopolymorpha sp. NPDC004070 TaxID=3154548 RepID=UPI0033A50B63
MAQIGMEQIGVVERVWRYPIKSVGGESLRQADVDERGLVGDRVYAVRDARGKLGSGKNSRRFTRMDGLLHLSSRLLSDADEPVLLDVDGTAVPDANGFLRSYLNQDDVELAREGEISHFDELPVSVLTTATLDWVRAAVPDVPVDERRFRPNLLVRTPPGCPPFLEDGWPGRAARIGNVRLTFVRSCVRCVMVNADQPTLPHSSDVLRTIAAGHDNCLGTLATVAAPGAITVGDTVALESQDAL